MLPLPSLPEQRRIAAILDQADALRAKRRAALTRLDEMARAIFMEMFGSSEKDLSRWRHAEVREILSVPLSEWRITVLYGIGASRCSHLISDHGDSL